MLSKLKSIFFNLHFLNFLVVGVFNAIFGYSIFALLIYLGLHYALAIALATALGVMFNFKTIGHFVFSSKDNRKIVKFTLVYIFIYILNTIGIKIINGLGLNYYISGLLMLCPLALISYFLNLKFVFK